MPYSNTVNTLGFKGCGYRIQFIPLRTLIRIGHKFLSESWRMAHRKEILIAVLGGIQRFRHNSPVRAWKALTPFAPEPRPSCSSNPGHPRTQIGGLPDGYRRGRQPPAQAAFAETSSRMDCRELPVSRRSRNYGGTAPRSKKLFPAATYPGSGDLRRAG